MNVVIDVVTLCHLDRARSLVERDSSEFAEGKRTGTDAFLATVAHQPDQRARIDAARQKRTHLHIGDQMSGAILGRELVRRTVEAADGLLPGSPLTDAVREKLGGNTDAVMDWSFPQDPRGPMPATNGAPSTLLGRAPAEFGALVPLFFDYYEKGDAVARKLMDIELGYIDNYVRWFKARGVKKMAAVGGFGTRLYPLMMERYGDFIVRPVSEPLHGAVILAKQNFA